MSTIRLLAKMPTIAAYAHKKSTGQPFLYPDNSLGYVDNFLRMTFGVPAEEYVVDPTASKALNLLFLLHADHEQNCSTSAVRHRRLQPRRTCSPRSPPGWARCPVRCTGGRTQAVLEMLAAHPAADDDDVGHLRRSG